MFKKFWKWLTTYEKGFPGDYHGPIEVGMAFKSKSQDGNPWDDGTRYIVEDVKSNWVLYRTRFVKYGDAKDPRSEKESMFRMCYVPAGALAHDTEAL